jgi:anti-anti-sigma regulatory factor
VVILSPNLLCPATPQAGRHPMKRRHMTRLHTQIESTGPIAVVRLIGAVDATTVATAETTVTEALTDQPDALLLDLSEVSCAEPAGLLAFSALARRARLWSGVPVILHAPDPVLHLMLTGQAVDRTTAVCVDRTAALVLARCAPTPYRLREAMQPVPGAARRARDLATEACLVTQAPELVGSASIVTSELVANAVRHAGTPFELTLTRTPSYLHIGVRDEDCRPAVRLDPDPDASTGRGLLVVEQTASSWGSTPAQHGKVVWAALATIR